MSISLTPIELERLKLLLSGKTLSTEEQNSTLDILRSRFSNFFSNLEPGLTEENLKDNKFLIKYLTNSYNRNKIKNALQKELSLSSSEQIELAEVFEEKPVAEEEGGGEVSGQGFSAEQEVPVGTTTGASAGGMPGMPSFPSISPAQRRIYRVSRQEPPKPEIHIANKSGYVTEAGDASKLVTTSGGVVKEAPPSKIFIADRTGAVTGEHPIMPASAAKLPSRKKEKKRWFGRLRSSASSNLLDFLPIDKVASWVWRNALKPILNFAWRSLLQPALRWLGSQAGRLLFQLLPRLAMAALDGLIGMLGGIGGLSGIAFAAGSALFWGGVFVVSFVVVTILATFLSPFITTPVEPVRPAYTLPLRNPNVAPHDIKAPILESWPQAQLDNWDTIIDKAKANNWNPALVLTLWLEASGAQDKVDRVLVCDPDPARPESALEINLRCFFKKYANYNDNEFPRFIEDYAKSNAPGTDASQGYESYYNEAFLQRIRDWYSQMVLEEELGAITPITIPTGPTLDYKIPFRDTTVSVSPTNVDIATNIIKISWPDAKLANWNTIVSQSIAANWNPAFVLALWIEESGAQGAANYSDALGCAPHQPTDDINISLKCLFDNFSQYQDSQFQQFMETYSGGPAGNPFGNNPNFPSNIKSWYATLIPAGSHGAIEPVAPPSGAQASCPVPGGVIKTPSYSASPTTGHCSPAYGSCPAESRRAKSIDVDTRGENVLFPTIDGQEVNWYFLNRFPLGSNDCEGGISDCGIMTVFQAPVGSTKWVLHLLHLDPNPNIISFDTSGPNRSRSIAGKTVSGVYVHINIGKDILNAQYPPRGDLDLDPGWLAPDFMCP